MANEKRLIDANKLLERIRKSKASKVVRGMCSSFIISAPTVDAVEVVRCRDCAKDGLTTCPLCWIENHTLNFVNHDPNFYCGAAERRTDND